MIDIAGLQFPHRILISEDVGNHFILGRDFLIESKANLDFNKRVITFSDMVETSIQNVVNRDTLVKTIKPIFIPALSEAICVLSCHDKFNNSEVIVQPLDGEQFKTFAIARSVNKVTDGKIVCKILNHQPTAVILPKGRKIARLDRYQADHCCVLNDQKQTSNKSPMSQTDNKGESNTTGKPASPVILETFAA